MDFHAEFFPVAFKKKIEHNEKLLLIGSCFTEQIGTKLSSFKFDMLQNPNGILFNPVSIVHALHSYVDEKKFTSDDLFYHNELWNSWKHHSRFSGMDKNQVLSDINKSQSDAHLFLKNANWLLITLGSAFVYEQVVTPKDSSYNEVVTNCHKIPLDKFNRRLLDPEEIKNVLKSMINKVKVFNPKLNIIFTISPVRHLREGFIGNNRSKAALIQAVHGLVNDDFIFYFPAYELIIDDLRDYRFYAEDMVHPNYSATGYVWEKFVSTCVDIRSQEIMKEIGVINAAINHKPFNPESDQHKKFKNIHLQKISMMMQKHHYLNFNKEISFLSMD